MAKATYTMLVADPCGLITINRAVPKPDLPTLQEKVEGLIEPVDNYLRGLHITAYANEEAHLLGMKRNLVGTKLTGWPYPIHGPVVFYFKDTNTKARKHFGV